METRSESTRHGEGMHYLFLRLERYGEIATFRVVEAVSTFLQKNPYHALLSSRMVKHGEKTTKQLKQLNLSS